MGPLPPLEAKDDEFVSGERLPPPSIPPKKGERKGDWAKVKSAKSIFACYQRFRQSKDQEFNPAEAYVRKYGVSAAGLLSVLDEEHFMRLNETWLALYDGQANPSDFLQLLRVLFSHMKLFDSDGYYSGGRAPGRNRGSGMNDMDYYIKELFVAIDVHKRGVVTWGNFVNFLIYGIIGTSEAHAFSGNQRDSHRRNESTYVLDNRISVGTSRKADFTHMKYYPSWNKVVAVSKKKAVVFDCAELKGKVTPRVYDHDATVLATAYSTSHKAFVTACSDFKLRVYGVGASQAVVKDYTLPVSATSLAFNKSGSMLYLGDRTGEFSALDFEKLMAPKPSVLAGHTVTQPSQMVHQDRFHTNTISDMLVLPNHNVVTVGLDSKVHLINPLRNYFTTPYESRVRHRHGVFSVHHSDVYHFLVTTGLEPYALIWVDNMPNIPSFKLSDPTSPHAAPLCGACCVPNTQQVFTIDTLGVTKLFDIRTCQLVDSFNMKSMLAQSEQDLPVFSVLHTGNWNRQLVYGSKGLLVFEHDSKSSEVPKMAHPPDHTLADCAYIAMDALFVSATTKELRVWNARNGHCTKTIPLAAATLLTSPITHVTIDPRKAGKVLVGHSNGCLTVVNAVTGKLIRSYTRHNTAIVTTALDRNRDFIATASQGGCVYLWMDMDPCALASVLPKGKKALFSTFEDEVRASQNPMSQMSALWAKKREGERSDAAVAAADKMKLMLAAAQTRRVFSQGSQGEAQEEVGEQKTSDAKKTRRLTHNPDVEPVARLQLTAEVRHLCFCAEEPYLLVVLASKDAFVYAILFEERIQFKLHSQLTHPPRTELSCGDFLDTSALVATADMCGVVHIWCLKYSKAVCVCRWYCSSPPRPGPKGHVVSGITDDNVSSAPDYTRRRDAATEILASLLSPAAHAEQRRQKKTVVSSVSCTAYSSPYLYTASEMGSVSCWDLSHLKRTYAEENEEVRKEVENLITGKTKRLSSALPMCVLNWVAHSENITRMEVLGTPFPHLMTLSFDLRIRLWTMHGSLLSSLRQGPIMNSTWHFTQTRAESGLRSLRSLVLWKRLRANVLNGFFNGACGGAETLRQLVTSLAAVSAEDEDEDCAATPCAQTGGDVKPGRAHQPSYVPRHRAKVSSPAHAGNPYGKSRVAAERVFEALRSQVSHASGTVAAATPDEPAGRMPRRGARCAAKQQRGGGGGGTLEPALKQLSSIIDGSSRCRGDRRREVACGLPPTGGGAVAKSAGVEPAEVVSAEAAAAAAAAAVATRHKPPSRAAFAPPRRSRTPCDLASCVGDGDALVRVPQRRSHTPASAAKPPSVSWTSPVPGGPRPLEVSSVTQVGEWVACTKFLSPNLIGRPSRKPLVQTKMRSTLRLQTPDDGLRIARLSVAALPEVSQ